MLKAILLIILSAVLYVFSFAPWDQAYLQWIAFIPTFFAIQKLEKEHITLSLRPLYQKIFLLGFILNALICAGGFYWITYAVKQYGELPEFAAIALFLVFCAIGQLHLPFYLGIRFFLQKSLKKTGLFWALLSAIVYVGIESFYPKIFTDTAGHAFYRSSWVRQAADIGGPFTLTFLILLFNETAFSFLVHRKRREAFALIALVFCTCGYGYFRVNQVQQAVTLSSQGPKLSIAMIQANIGDFMKVAAERGTAGASNQVIQSYLNLSLQASKGLASFGNKTVPDIILWPETAYPSLFGHSIALADQQIERAVKDFSNHFSGTLLFGGYDQDAFRNDYNSLFFLGGSDKKNEVYHKNILLTFGETLPFADSFPEMKTWFPNMGFFGRGPGPEVHQVPNRDGVEFKLAPQICYEGLFPYFSAQGAEQNADALINVTNDSWFGREGEPYLHLALTIFRTIESRTPLFRSTNTGFTTFVDATGEMTIKSELMKSDIVQAEIPKRPSLRSPFQVLGSSLGYHWFNHLLQILSVFILFFAFRSYRRSPPL